jgi:hypothetical protein
MNILKNLAFSEIAMRVYPGSQIGACINASISIAKTYRCRVNFEHNGVTLSVEPGDMPDEVLAAYYIVMGEKKKESKPR